MGRLETPAEMLRRRAQEVAARPNVPDPREVAIKRDADRWAQLAARQHPAPSQEVEEGEAEGGGPESEGGVQELTGDGSGEALPDAETEEAVGYRVEGPDRGWYKLIRNADDEQVGKSVRSADDAWALLESED